MKKYVRCKVCGFIGEEKAMKDVCPACGVPKTAFEEYKYTVSDKRLKNLNYHMHPILVHFPQSITFLSLIFIVIAFVSSGTVSSNLIIVEKLLSLLLPFSVLISMAAGIYDTKLRFKKKFGPLLKQKVIIGTVFLTASAASAVLINMGVFHVGGKIIIVGLSLVCFSCSGFLGKIGGSLLDAKLPG